MNGILGLSGEAEVGLGSNRGSPGKVATVTFGLSIAATTLFAPIPVLD